MSSITWMRRLAWAATIMTLVVVVLGAYVRLSDAGLGCPDWPGCYGHIGVPDEAHEIDAANAAFPERPVEIAKAWKEMLHRYVATALGVVILLIAALAIRARRRAEFAPLGLPLLLLGLVIFQGMLGMWTVTLLVKPAVVTAHLIGGMSVLSLCMLLSWRLHGASADTSRAAQRIRPLAYGALLVLIAQIILGGWVSTNYAALSCPDLPTCQGQWWPNPDFSDGFAIWRGTGIDYEGGVLSNSARVAVHLSHRLGAIVVTLVFAALIARLLSDTLSAGTRRYGAWIGVLLGAQLALGLSNIIFALPLWVATAHNAGAALLLLAMVSLLYRIRREP